MEKIEKVLKRGIGEVILFDNAGAMVTRNAVVDEEPGLVGYYFVFEDCSAGTQEVIGLERTNVAIGGINLLNLNVRVKCMADFNT